MLFSSSTQWAEAEVTPVCGTNPDKLGAQEGTGELEGQPQPCLCFDSRPLCSATCSCCISSKAGTTTSRRNSSTRNRSL